MERHEMFDEMLEECYPTIEIAGITFYPSDILFECDPIAYRVSVNDYQSNLCSDGYHESENEITCDWCGESVEEEV